MLLDIVLVSLIWQPIRYYNEELYWEINDKFGFHLFIAAVALLLPFIVTGIIINVKERPEKA